MKLSRRWNNFWIGFGIGIVLPLVVFVIIYLSTYSKTSFITFVVFSFRTQMLPKILSLCVAPNLGVFYIFLNKEFWYTTRGVIAATILLALTVGIVLFLA